jgi:extradiol dioxygenase family protein
MIDLVPATGARIEDALNVDHICLGIEASDMNELAAWLRDASVEVIGEPAMRYGARGAGLSIYIRDPEGNVVELKQLPAS